MKKLFFVFGTDKVSDLSADEKAYLIGYEIQGRRYALKRPTGVFTRAEAEASVLEAEQGLPGKLMLPDVGGYQILHDNLVEVNCFLEAVGYSPLERGEYWTSVKTPGGRDLIFNLFAGGWYTELPETEDKVVYCFV